MSWASPYIAKTMTDNSVIAFLEQGGVIRFFVNKGPKSADMRKRLEAQYVVGTFIRSETFEWCKLN